jgi:hypothetical protein
MANYSMYERKRPVEIFGYLTREKSDIFNLAELERLCGFPSGTLRHIRAGSRTATREQYKKVREILAPLLCEWVFALQNYE